MPRYEERDWEERRYGSNPYLSSNLYSRNGRSNLGLDGGGTRLYIGRLSSRTRSQDLEDLFSKYGRVRDVDMKHNFAFVEFLNVQDADDARYYTNGKDLDGSRLTVEFARRGPRGLGGGREYLGSGPTPGTGRCYNCGNEGHWARDCKAGDWRDKCYHCGERGHIERNCQNSPAFNSSVSRSRSHSPRVHGKSLKNFVQSQSRSRSRSYSTSPPRKDPNKRALRSKSESLTPPPKAIHSISISPGKINASPSSSPKPLRVNSHLQESCQDLSGPGMDTEKPGLAKGGSSTSPSSDEE